MNEAFLKGMELDSRSTLEQAEQLVGLALQQYDMDTEDIRFIQVSDHITYRIESKTGERFLLRLHSEITPKVEIVSEIIWLESLSKANKLIVPQGVANQQGTYVTEVELAAGMRASATIMRWIEGEPNNGKLTETDITKMGELMARLHLAAETFVPTEDFARPVWGEQSFDRSVLSLKEHYSTFLSDDEFQLYLQAADKITGCLAKLQSSRPTYGMIHADLHVGNIVFKQGEPFPIDFGRCGFGYFLYDIAQSLVGLYPLQRRVFIEGYRGIRGIGSDYVKELESFFVMACIENYSFHAPNPEETEHLKAQQPYAQAILRNYLSGTPFLFDAI